MGETREQLSAFLDDELNDGETELFVRRLTRDETLRRRALRYAVIGDAMRGDLCQADPRGLPDRLCTALADETVPGVGPAAGRRGRWLRPVAGAAVAATVAVAAVLSLRGPVSDVAEETAVTVPVASSLAGPGGSVAAVPQAISRRASTVPDRLSEYYLSHADYATLFRGQGQLVRIVTRPAPVAEGETDRGETADAEEDADQPTAR